MLKIMKRSGKSYWLNVKLQLISTEEDSAYLTSTKVKPHVSCMSALKISSINR